MAINKVKFGNQTLIDLTDTTATADKILTGFGAYGKDGVWMDGSLVPGADDGYVYQDEDNYVVLDDDEGVGVGVTPLTVTENGTYNAGTRRAYNPVTVDVQPTLQSKSVTPTESQQTVTPDSGKDGLSQVVVAGIDAGYVGSGVPRKNISDLAATSWKYSSNTNYDYINATISVPFGYYSTGGNMGFTKILTDITSLPTQSAVTITPTETRQTAAQSRRWLTGDITVAGISSTYVGSGVPTKSSADLTRNGATVTVPAGYYSGQATKSVASMTLPTTTSTTNTGTWKATVGGPTSTIRYLNIPAGYNSSSAYYTINSVSFMSLPTTTSTSPTGMMKANVTASSTNRYINIPSGYTGNSVYYTIRGDSDLIPENIKKGVNIFGVVGTAESDPELIEKTVTPSRLVQEITPISDEVSETLISNSANGFTTDNQVSSSVSSMNIVTHANLISGTTIEYPLHVRVRFSIKVRASTSTDLYEYLTVDSEALFTEANQVVTIGEFPNRYFMNFSIGLSVDSSQTYFTIMGKQGLTWGYVTALPNTQQEPDLFGIYVIKNNGEVHDGLSKVTVNPVPSSYFNYMEILAGMFYNDMYTRFGSSGITTLGSEITYIGGCAFAFQNLQRIDSPYVLKLSESAFTNCQNLTSVSLPNVNVIGQNVFSSCYKLSSVYFPAVVSIDTYRFRHCSSLATISFPNLIYMSGSAFSSCSSLTSAIFPVLESIPNYAFYGCSNLSLFSASLVSTIGTSAFFGCSKLSTIYLPQTWAIDGSAFFNTGITEITSSTFSSLYSYISNSTFGACKSLSYVSLPNVSYVGNYAFVGCTSLQEVYLPQVTTINTRAFSNCSQLQTISIPNASSIGQSCFASASALQSIKLPAATYIGSYAFYSCYSLNTVIIGNTPSFSMYAFQRCYNLLSLYLLGSSIRSFGGAAMFSSTPISNYTTSTGGVYGSIFVPASLYDSYKTATGWATYQARFVSLTDAQISAILNS